MNNTLGIITEILIMVFNALIYMQLTVLKKDTKLVRAFIYSVCAVLIGSYFVATYFFKLPEALSSFVIVSLPSFLLFFCFSKYKDFRFFVVFCFLDTIALILTFFSRATAFLIHPSFEMYTALLICILLLFFYIFGKNQFKRYRELLGSVKDGWKSMTLSVLMIYLLLIFAAAYPVPLIERTEFFPVYGFMCVTILSFYVVFILSVFQKKKLYDMNVQLENEKKWHKIAYKDGLTGTKNRMAYIEEINELERNISADDELYAIMLDINKFKRINDTYGHHAGDELLKNAANVLSDIFPSPAYELYRIGGDEFAIIALKITNEELLKKVNQVKNVKFETFDNCTFSLGYSMVQNEQNNAIESAFKRADKAMYKDKMNYTANA